MFQYLYFLQISSLVFAPNYKELVSGHGFAHDKVIIWKYPSLTKVAELEGKFFFYFSFIFGQMAFRSIKVLKRMWGHNVVSYFRT